MRLLALVTDGIGANGGTFFNERLLVFAFSNDVASGINDIGKNTGGTAKNIVLQRYGIVDGHVVLNFDIVADRNIIADEDILTERTPRPDARLRTNVHEVPDAAPRSQHRALVDDRRRMNECCRHGLSTRAAN